MMATNLSDDESSDDEMLQRMQQAVVTSSIWIWNAMQLCARDMIEAENDKPRMGRIRILDILHGHHSQCYKSFRMSPENFMILCDEVRQKGLLSNGELSVEEQVGMFLQIGGHSAAIREVGDGFQHSTETVWRTFNNVLCSVLRMQHDYIKLPGQDAPIHPKLSEGTLYAPFQGALGAIDGTHIPAIPNPDDDNPDCFRNLKEIYSQNVMAAVDFDGNFLAVVAGWEGCARDNLVLQAAMEEGFAIPPDKYYLVDLGYANANNFLGPYRGRTYDLGQFCAQQQHNHYECPEDLYNCRHAQLRNVVEKTFGNLKVRFKICQRMCSYKFKIQTKIVIACCILHNFINHQNMLQQISDELFFNEPVQIDISEGNIGILIGIAASDTEGANLRDTVKNALWASR